MREAKPGEMTADDDQNENEPEEFDGGEAEAQAEPAPAWLVDLRRSPHRQGFYRGLGNHALVFADRGADRLVVSFDNLSSVRDDVVNRDPWGYGFVARQGWSQLGVLAFTPDWFRDPALFAALSELAGQGFFARYRSVTLTGTSMGGYAACAFASLAPGCQVIAFSPQSTLAKPLVPWEKRFSAGRKADWSGPFADGASGLRHAGEAWLVHDPCCTEDARHIARFNGGNLRHLRMRHAGHKTALALRRAGLLGWTVAEAIEGRLTETRFQIACRGLRREGWYLDALAARAAARGDFRHIGRLVSLLAAQGQGFAAHRLRKDYLVGNLHDPLRNPGDNDTI